jgi:hypothetical protein
VFATPAHIVEAAVEALHAGFTHYVPAPGLPVDNLFAGLGNIRPQTLLNPEAWERKTSSANLRRATRWCGWWPGHQPAQAHCRRFGLSRSQQ